MQHTFHIPVLGLAFSIDSPIKIAQFGISSAVSIVDDNLTERLREYHSKQHHLPFEKIDSKTFDARAKRLTAYLDMMQVIIDKQIISLKSSSFSSNEALHQYFNMLPAHHSSYKMYQLYLKSNKEMRDKLEPLLKQEIVAGEIEVNIMSKVDKVNKDKAGNLLERKYSDATAALRGFANSSIKSTVILSAGMNPNLYNYLADLSCFIPNTDGSMDKKVCLKVSDYRSAYIQAKYLAKKGIWISEFRIESGLNCGGHAFATDGYLLGPILEEFKQNRHQLIEELFPIYKKAIAAKGGFVLEMPRLKITAQGGVGTGKEHQFLVDYYHLDSIGWGSPFLFVPEATTVDDRTLEALVVADKNDFYLSDASPLGVPFHNFRKSTAEKQRIERVHKNRAGAPCTKKYLISNHEFSVEPVCTASREYQHTKLKELDLLAELDFIDSSPENVEKLKKEVTNKTCLCEGLAAAAYLKYDIAKSRENTAVAICPGPNTAYFDRTYSLAEMVAHIYGRTNVLKDIKRSSLFINELRLYIEYLKKHHLSIVNPDEKQQKTMRTFQEELLKGITYYETLAEDIFVNDPKEKKLFLAELQVEKKLIEDCLLEKNVVDNLLL